MDEESFVSEAQNDRKQRSEDRLRAEGVPVNGSLPCIENESETTFRTVDEVVDRSIALMVVAGNGEQAPPDLVARFMVEIRALPKLTPAERAFMEKPDASPRELAQYSWRYEALRVLLWSLGFLPALPRPSAQIDPGELGSILMRGTEASFRESARLQSRGDLLDFCDLLYRYHWAVRNAELYGQAWPAGLNGDVVMEWDYASRWLIGYQGQEWDDIDCGT